MGIAGTEVAKESSDIIILDDNFASIVKVVRWGRLVYANIQKFIQFQLVVNVAALVINIVAAISSGDVPLNAVQLLWINLIMDSLGALTLAAEAPTDKLMRRSPVGRREPLITNIVWRNLMVRAIFQVVVLLTLDFHGKSIIRLNNEIVQHAEKVKNTFIFNTFLFCQVFNEFNARKPDEKNVFKGATKNHLFLGIIGFTVVLQILIIEFLGKFTSTVRLKMHSIKEYGSAENNIDLNYKGNRQVLGRNVSSKDQIQQGSTKQEKETNKPKEPSMKETY